MLPDGWVPSVRLKPLARKHCGAQSRWSISLELLQKKFGSKSTDKEFKRLVGTIVRQNEVHDHFSDYVPTLETDRVTFHRRDAMPAGKTKAHSVDATGLKPETLVKAKQAAPGYDVYALYADWQAFCEDSGAIIERPDAAFIGFCRKRHERHPMR